MSQKYQQTNSKMIQTYNEECSCLTNKINLLRIIKWFRMNFKLIYDFIEY
jgi:hypothetical protein